MTLDPTFDRNDLKTQLQQRSAQPNDQNQGLRDRLDAEQRLVAELRGQLHELRTHTPDAQELADLRALVVMVDDNIHSGRVYLKDTSIGLIRRTAAQIRKRAAQLVELARAQR